MVNTVKNSAVSRAREERFDHTCQGKTVLSLTVKMGQPPPQRKQDHCMQNHKTPLWRFVILAPSINVMNYLFAYLFTYLLEI